VSELKDPRVLFAAERTLMAWNRTAISLMAFGFVVERFGLFLQLVATETKVFQRQISFIVGITFVLLGTFVAFYSILQHRRVLKSLRPEEIPSGYHLSAGMLMNTTVGILGALLSFYLFRGFL